MANRKIELLQDELAELRSDLSDVKKDLRDMTYKIQHHVECGVKGHLGLNISYYQFKCLHCGLTYRRRPLTLTPAEKKFEPCPFW